MQRQEGVRQVDEEDGGPGAGHDRFPRRVERKDELRADERRQDDVREDDEVDLVEEGSRHEELEAEIEQGEQAHDDALQEALVASQGVVDDGEDERRADEERQQAGQVALVHAQEVALVEHLDVDVLEAVRAEHALEQAAKAPPVTGALLVERHRLLLMALLT